MSEMKWFSVRMLLESVLPHEANAGDVLYEDRIILVLAETEEEAKSKGERIGRTARGEYKNQYGETVKWEFREVVDVIQLLDGSVADGTEVYWSFLGEEEVKQLRKAYHLPE